ncbi:DUF1631 domain-containing protein [Xanthomonadaceae bacterium JHOS43]|nr:DUF1631 domain-containing protein [Xanthomonadaceae bacterium JHOS43]
MTAPSPTDKIVDLSARTGAARGEANPMLATIRTRALKRLAGLASDVLEKADDTLFDFVQRADGTVSNQDYFDAMRELRKQRPLIEQRYVEHLAAAFSALERRNPLEVDLERSLSESRELSLVSEEQLEEQLGTSMIATALSRLLGPMLSQLNYRMGIVAGVDELDEKSNPIAPPHIAYAFRHAMQPCEISIRIKVLLFKLYEREMARGLGTFYNETNRALVEAGIASEIKPAYARTPQMARTPSRPRDDSPARADEMSAESGLSGHGTPPPGNYGGGSGYNTVTMDAPPPGSRYVRVPETAAEQSIFTSLHELLSGYRRVQAQTMGMPMPESGMTQEPGVAAAPQMSVDEVLSVLSLFQNEMPTGLQEAVSDPSRSITQHLKQELQKGAARLGLNPESRMTPADEDSIDLVGMLFDVLLDERDFNASSRQTIGRLIVPFIKVAMLDRRMFLQKTHPARRLLNSLAEACEGNAGEAPQERELLSRVEVTIDRLVAEFNEDIAIFETLEQEFREFIEQHRRRVALAERRTAEAQRGKERLEHARATSLEDLRAVLERHSGMPAVIEAFLRRYWTHHLTLCALRDEGGDSGKYIEAVAVGEDLASLSGLDNVGDRSVRLDALRPRIEPILLSAGCTGSAAEDVLNSLRHALGHEDQAVPAAPEAEVEAVTALERNAPPVEAIPEPVAEPEEEEVGPALDFDEADAERVRKLQVGAWIQFTEENGTTVPAKLSWVSPISNRMLFVNRRGLRYCVASPEELAAMMRAGRLNIRQTDAAFEHAMSQVLGKLRSGGQGAMQ